MGAPAAQVGWSSKFSPVRAGGTLQVLATLSLEKDRTSIWGRYSTELFAVRLLPEPYALLPLGVEIGRIGEADY